MRAETSTPHVALSLMTEDDFRLAALPLFEEGVVDAVEWSFDLGWSPRGVPGWIDAMLGHYGDAHRLYGHGVAYSPLSARFEPRQQRWLDRLARACATHRYRHVSEHFGFMTAGDFTRGAPLPVPFDARMVEIGVDRLRRLKQAAGGVDVGLENLALAFCRDDVETHGAFLRALVAPLDGFVVLDLHNLFCQSINFDLPMDSLLEKMPLDRVRELHVSGGSWSMAKSGGRPFRRDTHDGDVPAEVLDAIPRALARCPHVEVVVFERIGGSIADADAFRRDFQAIRARVKEGSHARAR